MIVDEEMRQTLIFAAAGRLYMTAPEASGSSFTFTVQCGLMKINLSNRARA